MKRIVSFNPEKLLEDKVIKDYHVDGNNLVITFKDDSKEYYYKKDGSYVKYDIPDGYKGNTIYDDEYVIIGCKRYYLDNLFLDGMTQITEYCYLNKLDGTLLYNNLYDDYHPFSEGMAVVGLNGKLGCVDKKGNVIIPIEYDYVSDCKYSRIIVKKDGLYACFDKNGNMVRGFSQNKINDFVDGLTVGENCIFDVNFKKLFECDKLIGVDIKNKKFLYKLRNKFYLYDNGKNFDIKYPKDKEEREEVLKWLNEERKYGVPMVIDDRYLYEYGSNYYGLVNFEKKGLSYNDYYIYCPRDCKGFLKPYKDGDPVFTFGYDKDFHCFNEKYYNALRFYNGYAFVKKDYNSMYILIDKNGNKVMDTIYEKFCDSKDGLQLFEREDGMYAIVNYKNDLIKTFKYSRKIEFIYNNIRYVINDLKFTEYNQVLDKKINIVISENSKLLESNNNIKVRDYVERPKDGDSVEEEVRLYFDIMDILIKYDSPVLDDKLSSIIEKYNNESDDIRKKEIEKRRSMSMFTMSSDLTSKQFYNEYLNKLSRYLDRLKHYSDIIDVINGFKDEKEKSDNELVKDFYDLKKIYENLHGLNINVLNLEFDKIKDIIVNDIISDKDNYIYENYNTFEIYLRSILQRFLLKIKEQTELQGINNQIKFKKDILNDREKNQNNSLLLDIKEIYKMVEYIESITDDKEILDKLDKFKNIKLDLSKDYSENSKYVYELLKEIIRIKIKVDFIYAPNRYKSKL